MIEYNRNIGSKTSKRNWKTWQGSRSKGARTLVHGHVSECSLHELCKDKQLLQRWKVNKVENVLANVENKKNNEIVDQLS